MQLATKTLELIETSISADQGATYRGFLGKVIPHMGDAYRATEDGFRAHLGASMIGRKCARDIWYGFRWVKKPRFSGRMIRLFNRGHLEEARFIAILLSVGVQVYQQDGNGNQFRVSFFGSIFGGSGDGVGIGIPDLPPGHPCLLEFKTHSSKSFEKLKSKGVREAKPEHYSQMQVYMKGMGLGVALYGAVNKDNDELHMEIVHYNAPMAEQMVERAYNIITIHKAPDKISNSSSWYECKYCEHRYICHHDESVERNCRTCHHARINPEAGTWACGQTGEVLSKEAQLKGCGEWVQFEV